MKVLGLGIFLCHLLQLLAFLGISFFEYMQDRISQKNEIPSLANIIRDKCFFSLPLFSSSEELFYMSG